MDQTSNVGIRMARIEEMEKTLNFLDRVRPTIGDAAYEKSVQSLATSLQNPKSFSKDVEVIVLHDSLSDDDFDENNKENRSGDNHDHHSEDEDADDDSSDW